MIKGSDAQKQMPHKLLWMLWFDEKSISNVHLYLMHYAFVKAYAKGREKNDESNVIVSIFS